MLFIFRLLFHFLPLRFAPIIKQSHCLAADAEEHAVPFRLRSLRGTASNRARKMNSTPNGVETRISSARRH